MIRRQKVSKGWYQNLKKKTVDEYILRKFVGSGKIGYVYRAEHTDFPGSDWAIKLVFGDLTPGWDKEVRKVMSLALIPGVVHFHGLGTAQITHDNKTLLCQYTVWDYISPGENLKAYMERAENVSTSFLYSVINQVLHVLHACQVKGVERHGDLHSGNILIGDATTSTLDDSLEPRAPIFVSDFGYGATNVKATQRDDYEGLANIVNEIVRRIDYSHASVTDRQILQSIKQVFNKLLKELNETERRPPLDLLSLLKDIKRRAQSLGSSTNLTNSKRPEDFSSLRDQEHTVGQFQVSEMIGDRWDWWRFLFVPSVPAKSKILALDIPTVLTGPRGCGKTMLLRRLSERLVIECEEIDRLTTSNNFVAFYVNANDFADAFAHFPINPSPKDEAQLICYANLCILADLLSVQSARAGRLKERASDSLIELVRKLLLPEGESFTLFEGEDSLERFRSALEQIKWKFPISDNDQLSFPGYKLMSQHRWLPHFINQSRNCCKWIIDKYVLIFLDDYSIPRVSFSMQRVLNRLFFQRSSEFLSKIATEASTTFVTEDSSGKILQDGDDYQLVDMGEEALFLPDAERSSFLNEIFSRRLSFDPRIPEEQNHLNSLLSRSPLSKTEFARRLRDKPANTQDNIINGDSQRRGRSKMQICYYGDNVFVDLWSGDTRTMIQLITDLVDQVSEAKSQSITTKEISLPIKDEIQDRVFRNRGGEWLNAQTRNDPTSPNKVKECCELIKESEKSYKFCGGEYGDHLKAVVETFVALARQLLLGPTYKIKEGKTIRKVPRMAFRLEIIDEFRIDGLAREIYRDLVRYGIFMRDSRGKSVRGTFVPRLYLRRLLLPFCRLALSKRDSVQLTCNDFIELLLRPDVFKSEIKIHRKPKEVEDNQIPLFQQDFSNQGPPDPAYNDIDDGEE